MTRVQILFLAIFIIVDAVVVIKANIDEDKEKKRKFIESDPPINADDLDNVKELEDNIEED
jgi:hypothetical protein